MPPIDRQFSFNHGTAVSDNALQQRMDLKVIRYGCNDFAQADQFGSRNGGKDRIAPLTVKLMPIGVETFVTCSRRPFADRFAGFHFLTIVIDERFDSFGSYHILIHQFVGIYRSGSRVNGNLAIHQRLSQSRCILFVVTKATEANYVKQDIAFEGGAELHGQTCGKTTLSGSSALTWITGASINFAGSVQ